MSAFCLAPIRLYLLVNSWICLVFFCLMCDSSFFDMIRLCHRPIIAVGRAHWKGLATRCACACILLAASLPTDRPRITLTPIFVAISPLRRPRPPPNPTQPQPRHLIPYPLPHAAPATMRNAGGPYACPRIVPRLCLFLVVACLPECAGAAGSTPSSMLRGCRQRPASTRAAVQRIYLPRCRCFVRDTGA